MDYNICVNVKSLSAKSKDEAEELFFEAIQGLLQLSSGEERFLFYLDDNSKVLADCELSDGYTYDDFLQDYIVRDPDLALFLQEVEDKSPALDNLTDDEVEEISDYQFYVPGQPVDQECDIYGIAWTLSAILLSLGTEEVWLRNKVYISRTEGGEYIEGDDLSLNNISCQRHGEQLYDFLNREERLEEVCDPHLVHEDVLSWFDQQSPENQRRMLDKIRVSLEKNFSGGEPLFKNLTNADGVREIRFSAYPGGTIRVLFKVMSSGNQAILFSFIKKRKDEGYDYAIGRSLRNYSDICSQA